MKNNHGKGKHWFILALTAAVLLGGLRLWAAAAEPGAHWSPGYARTDIVPLLERESLTDEDYRVLYLQTGLSPYSISILRETGREKTILAAQDAFFAEPDVCCTPNSPISCEEHTDFSTPLLALEDGDILITPCSHTYGWRNGHAALVIDAERGLTLESVVLGQDSCVQRVSKWETYPAVLVLRLRGVSAEQRAEIAAAARERLCGVPYGLTVGLLSDKHPAGEPHSTHCAHLVWEAYRTFGYDLDSTGGWVVTPRDLANSSLLEVKQVYGLPPGDLWQK